MDRRQFLQSVAATVAAACRGGEPIGRFCSSRSLNVSQRVELFLQVLDVV